MRTAFMGTALLTKIFSVEAGNPTVRATGLDFFRIVGSDSKTPLRVWLQGTALQAGCAAGGKRGWFGDRCA